MDKYPIDNARHSNINMDVDSYTIHWDNGYYHAVLYNKDGYGIASSIHETEECAWLWCYNNGAVK